MNEMVGDSQVTPQKPLSDAEALDKLLDIAERTHWSNPDGLTGGMPPEEVVDKNDVETTNTLGKE